MNFVTEVFNAIDLDRDESLNLGTDIPVLGKLTASGNTSYPRRRGPGRADQNGDGILNLKDVYLHIDRPYSGMGGYLLARLSKNIDKNQDGQVELGELLNFVNTVFRIVDQNDDEHVAADDVFKIFVNNGVPEHDVAVMKTFWKSLLTFFSETFMQVADQFLKELDGDRDHRIAREELYGIHQDMFQGRGFYTFRIGKFPEPERVPHVYILPMIADILDNPIY